MSIPFSFSVGTSGNSFDRFSPKLASTRNLTPLMCWSDASIVCVEACALLPSIAVIAGPPPAVGRCRIFGNFAGYTRALEIAGSPNIGVCLCVGSWIAFGRLNRVFDVDGGCRVG